MNTAKTIARWLIAIAALSTPAFATTWVGAADDDHVVTQVIKGLVYVSLGTRDGVAVGQRIEVLDGGAVVGVLELELCGEVICRAKLPPAMDGKVLRGMLVRRPLAAGATSSAPKVEPAPTASASESAMVAPTIDSTFEPEPEKPTQPAPTGDEPAPANKPKKKPTKVPEKPTFTAATGLLTLEDVLAPYGAPREYRGGEVPPGYRLTRVRDSGLTRGGWWTWGLSYGLGVLGGLGSKDGAILLLPVAGPWIHVASGGSAVGVLSGLGQAVGAIVLVSGYTGTMKLVPKGSVAFVPALSHDTLGAGLVGSW